MTWFGLNGLLEDENFCQNKRAIFILMRTSRDSPFKGTSSFDGLNEALNGF
jgi:hypothetical protein